MTRIVFVLFVIASMCLGSDKNSKKSKVGNNYKKVNELVAVTHRPRRFSKPPYPYPHTYPEFNCETDKFGFELIQYLQRFHSNIPSNDNALIQRKNNIMQLVQRITQKTFVFYEGGKKKPSSALFGFCKISQDRQFGFQAPPVDVIAILIKAATTNWHVAGDMFAYSSNNEWLINHHPKIFLFDKICRLFKEQFFDMEYMKNAIQALLMIDPRLGGLAMLSCANNAENIYLGKCIITSVIQVKTSIDNDIIKSMCELASLDEDTFMTELNNFEKWFTQKCKLIENVGLFQNINSAISNENVVEINPRSSTFLQPEGTDVRKNQMRYRIPFLENYNTSEGANPPIQAPDCGYMSNNYALNRNAVSIIDLTATLPQSPENSNGDDRFMQNELVFPESACSLSQLDMDAIYKQYPMVRDYEDEIKKILDKYPIDASQKLYDFCFNLPEMTQIETQTEPSSDYSSEEMPGSRNKDLIWSDLEPLLGDLDFFDE